MSRRALMSLLGGTAMAAWPLAARAQTPATLLVGSGIDLRETSLQ